MIKKLAIIINTAFNYASENNYAYFTPLKYSEVLLSTNSEIDHLFKDFSVDVKEIYLRGSNSYQVIQKKKNNQETLVQGNVIMLMEHAQAQCKKKF